MTTEEPVPVPLRIVRGHAEPEELAALTVILLGRLALARAAAGDGATAGDGGAAPGGNGLTDRQLDHHRVRCACWAGCWTCG
ncbi:acyl-CoA carboxylase subunit epsilon [Streptomyces sp. RS10V-4]|uniref:acyl-CoA carboxylase subunit epsilon n=1 Tax=Streptomyces rhizoryzae TaxID=2932493 RepID=UPI002005AC63|nr:acyl-CoA carboxylase subunit epsilon [Streptomyces rhizoryzae]MCK7627146.1 acyl-CoA carboxylase subunit epsilon [Streptomyces rhizoryzae]